jgi:flavin reductase (DIM6/NTAB) family NADH-FMN oxidoreductase RutF
VNHFRTCAFFAINVLDNAQRELSVTFAANPEGRFDGLQWNSGQTGSPIFPASLAIIECKMDRLVEAGDHVILFGEMVHAQAHSGNPLIYFNRTYRTLQ